LNVGYELGILADDVHDARGDGDGDDRDHESA
jgi:hypothetical protein